MNLTPEDFRTGYAFFKPSKTKKRILVKFTNHTEEDCFPADCLEELKKEKNLEYILDAATGEIIYDPFDN